MQKYNFNNYKIKIGSRRSPLAVWQAQAAMKRLGKNTELIKISTSGDKKLNKKLAEYGGKGLFTKELEEALEKRKIDIAVHALKDLPAIETKGLIVNTFLERNDPREIIITKDINFINKPHHGQSPGTLTKNNFSKKIPFGKESLLGSKVINF